MRSSALALAAALWLAADHQACAQSIAGGQIVGTQIGPTAERSVLLVIIDDYGIDRDENYGAAGGWIPASTPATDTLAAQGARFSGALVNSVCAPTRSSLMQGAFNASNDGGTGVLDATGATWDDDRDSHIALLLAAAGVEVEAYGKVQFVGVPTAGRWGINHVGFDRARVVYQGQIGHWDWGRTESDQAGYLAAAPTWETDPPITDAATSGYLNDWITDQALDGYAARDRRQPYFGWVAMFLPHDPINDPSVEDSDAAYCLTIDSPAYTCQARMRTRLEANLSQILASVDLATTIVIVVGDNGSIAGTSGVPNGGKGSVTEPGMRVPLYVIGGGIAPQVISDRVHAVDVWATILDLHGVTSYAGADAVDGYSFRELLGETCGFTGRCWDDRPADRGIVIASITAVPPGDRAYYSDAAGAVGYKLVRNWTTGAVKMHNISSYTAGSAEPTDLCGGDGNCTGISGAAATAYGLLCAGLDADDNPGGAACPSL